MQTFVRIEKHTSSPLFFVSIVELISISTSTYVWWKESERIAWKWLLSVMKRKKARKKTLVSNGSSFVLQNCKQLIWFPAFRASARKNSDWRWASWKMHFSNANWPSPKEFVRLRIRTFSTESNQPYLFCEWLCSLELGSWWPTDLLEVNLAAIFKTTAHRNRLEPMSQVREADC